MAKIELLDCTLRDGAYIVNGDFGDDVIVGLIKKLDAANADIIECGWLKDAPHKDGSVYYHVPEDVRKYMPLHRKSVATYTVMIDWDRYNLDAFDYRPFTGVVCRYEKLSDTFFLSLYGHGKNTVDGAHFSAER